jgi:hypothetical protein
METRRNRLAAVAFSFAAVLVLAVVALVACDSKDPVTPGGGNGGPTAGTPVCLDFEDNTSGSTTTVGNSLSANGVAIQVEQFQYSSGGWTTGGSARIHDEQYGGGTGLDLYPNNCNLNFQFAYPGVSITFKMGEYGGNNNIRVNGVFQNVLDLSTLDGTIIGGVAIAVAAGNPTTMTLTGNITGFTIGGQEFWLDDICFTPAQ